MRFEKSGTARMTERSRRAHLSSVLVVNGVRAPVYAACRELDRRLQPEVGKPSRSIVTGLPRSSGLQRAIGSVILLHGSDM